MAGGCVFVWRLGLTLFSILWIGIAEAGSDVYLSNAIIDNNGTSFHVECDYSQFVNDVKAQNPNAQIKFHVRIMAEKTALVDKELTPNDVTVGKSFLSYDGGIDKNMNKDYRCEMRATIAGSKKVVVSTSEEKFLGIRATTNRLTVTEGDVTNLTIVSTVPILCQRYFGSCCLDLDLQIGGPKNQLATFTKCIYQICSTDWDKNLNAAIKNISVIANPDNIRDGNTDLNIQFRPLVPSGGGRVKQVFDNVNIPPVPVRVIDHAPGKCLIGGDPHIRRFSNRAISFQEVGDYILYQNRQQNVDVHIRTWPCADYRIRRISCVSGVLIHDGNDVLKVSIADGITLPRFVRRWNAWDRLRFRHSYTRLTLTTDHNNLRDGTQVSVQHGRFVTVKTPSGTVVTMHHSGRTLNTLVSVPPNFRHDPHQNGLCGPFGQNGTHFTDPQGRIHNCQPFRRGNPACRNARFTDSWKLDSHNTLFYNPPNDKPQSQTKNTTYCGCADAPTGSTTPPAINCTGDGNKSPRGNNGCPLCSATGVQPGLYGGTFGKRSIQNHSRSDDGFDPFQFNLDVPNFVGPDHFPNVTQPELDKIEKMCRQAVDASHMKQHCGGQTSMGDDYVNQCIDDTVLAGDDSFAASAADGYNAECFHELQQDPNMYKTKPDGSLEMKDELAHMCPMGCRVNETCVKGVCKCDNGMPGPDCNPTTTTTTSTTSSPTSSPAPTSSTAPTSAAPTSAAIVEAVRILSFTQNGHETRGDVCDVKHGKCESIRLHIEGQYVSTHRNFHPHGHLEPVICVWEAIQTAETTALAYGEINSRNAPVLMTDGTRTSQHEATCPVPVLYIGSDRGKAYSKFSVHIAKTGHYLSRAYANFAVYDSDCVNMVNGSFTPSGKSCIINRYCHSDGSRNVLVAGERCMVNSDIHAWSRTSSQPMSGTVKKLTLDGPDDSLIVTCGVGSSTKRRQVEWLVNDREVKGQSQTVLPGQTSVKKDLLQIWGSGPPLSIQCRLHPDASDNKVYISDSITIA